jgi:hypothetical protein
MKFRRAIVIIAFCLSTSFAVSIDSLFEPLLQTFDFLPEYYLQFGLSAFALHRDAFFKRQYLAEPHPNLEFCLISYKDIIASVWQADFQFGLGHVPGDNVFTVLNVAFGYNPTIEVRLKPATITVGAAHRCFHEIDRKDFPVAYYNRLHLGISSPNARLNTYWSTLAGDSLFSQRNRFAFTIDGGYYLKEFFGLVASSKLNGHIPELWQARTSCRYAVYKRRSWIVALYGQSLAGTFSRDEGYTVGNGGIWYWKQTFGAEAYFTRGARGGYFYVYYHLDDLPAAPSLPDYALGHSRFSKNGLAQIGVVFIN